MCRYGFFHTKFQYKLKEILSSINDKNIYLYLKLERAKEIYEVLKNYRLLKICDVFISMRFDDANEKTFYIIKDAIRKVEEQENVRIDVVRLDKPVKYGVTQKTYNIYKDIVQQIMETQIMIADISQSDDPNDPNGNENIFHEIGMKTALDYKNGYKEPRIIVIQNRDKGVNKYIPFNVKNLQIEYYSSDTELIEIITRRVAEYMKI